MTVCCKEDASTGLPGFVERDRWVRETFNRGPKTAKRWQDLGLLVVKRFGRKTMVDVQATLERAREKGRPRRR